MKNRISLLSVWALLSLVISCEESATISGTDGDAKYTSEAQFVDFEWDGKCVAASGDPKENISKQIRYTVGQLNGQRALGRLDDVQITHVVVNETEISYHAKMTVAWSKARVPSKYQFYLPKYMSKQSDFVAKYGTKCFDADEHEASVDDGWYYFRPMLAGCDKTAEEFISFRATVQPTAAVVTSDKYPEYQKVWEDGALRVVTIFGMYESTTEAPAEDIGIQSFNEFISEMATALEGASLTTVPAGANTVAPAPELRDIELRGTFEDGRRVVINAFSVPNFATASNELKKKYESLSAAADVIVYAGHSGLGANIRRMAQLGKWVRDQYTMVLMNGCDTFAYIDPALFNSHAAVNPDDPTGTRYVDMFVNAMPSQFKHNADSIGAIVEALMAYREPSTYLQILSGFADEQVALVMHEEDNVYKPGYVGKELKVDYQKIDGLQQGKWMTFGPYSVKDDGIIKIYTSGNFDLDLYVKQGEEASKSAFDCKSMSNFGNEQCVLTGKGDYYVTVYALSGGTEEPTRFFDLTVAYEAAETPAEPEPEPEAADAGAGE